MSLALYRIRTCRIRAAFIVVAAWIWISPAHAFVVTCVPPGNSQAFQTALTTAASNGDTDAILLPVGTYVAPGPGFVYDSNEPYGLIVSGRWEDDCSDDLADGVSVLDGLYNRTVLSIEAGQGASVVVTNLRFFRGDGLLNPGSGLSVVADPGPNGEVHVALNEFIANGAENTVAIAGGLAIQVLSGDIRVSNNLFVGNRGTVAGGAVIFSPVQASFAPMTSNTFVHNPGGGLYVSEGVFPVVSNSVFWANEGFDLRIPDDDALVFYNDIGVLLGIPHDLSAGNLNIDPGFVGSDNFRLTPASPLVNAGREDVSYGLTQLDLDDHARVQGGFVDIGAYELRERIFVDGFD